MSGVLSSPLDQLFTNSCLVSYPLESQPYFPPSLFFSFILNQMAGFLSYPSGDLRSFGCGEVSSITMTKTQTWIDVVWSSNYPITYLGE
jgi:hypothetical protein